MTLGQPTPRWRCRWADDGAGCGDRAAADCRRPTSWYSTEAVGARPDVYGKASNAGSGRRIRVSVALSGDTLAVGAAGKPARPPGSTTATRPTTVQPMPARSTCSSAAARRGPSRRTSRPPTPVRMTTSAIRSRCPATRWRSVRPAKPARPPGSTATQADNSAADCRRGLRVRADRHDVDPAGVPQGLQYGGGDFFGGSGRAVRRHAGRRCARRSQRGHRGQAATRPTTAQPTPARSTCSFGAARPGPSRRTSRRPIPGASDEFGNSVALSGDTLAVGAHRRIQRGHRGQAATRPTTAQAMPARSTCSCAPARRGPSRPTSRPPIPGQDDISALRSRCPATRWRSVRESEASAATGVNGNQADNSATVPARSTCSCAPARRGPSRRTQGLQYRRQ